MTSLTLTKKQFDILQIFEQKKEDANQITQGDLAKTLKSSIATIGNAIVDLTENGYISGGKITKKGLNELEPYRVKRAIFIAAGFGSRLVPITLNTPKPLVRVNGKRMIDTLLDAVVAAGIDEIYIVRGYLAEQFDQLLYKYPTIKFIQNDEYNEANNISSAVKMGNFVENSYVFEADLVLYNANLVTKYQYCSNYLGVPVEKTDDWCFSSKDGFISKLTIGGEDCHHMIGVSYWTQKDGQKLKNDILDVYNAPGGKERYWDQVALEYHLKNYKVAIRECSFEDIIEIDTFNELKKIDKTYCKK